MALFSDIYLDKETHDIVVEGKDLKFSDDTVDSVTQRLKIRLKFFKGEWFLNTSFGVPYYQSILRKGVTKTKIDGIFKQAILDTEGVVSIVSFMSTFSSASRSYSITFSCRSTTGDTITLEI